MKTGDPGLSSYHLSDWRENSSGKKEKKESIISSHPPGDEISSKPSISVRDDNAFLVGGNLPSQTGIIFLFSFSEDKINPGLFEEIKRRVQSLNCVASF